MNQRTKLHFQLALFWALTCIDVPLWGQSPNGNGAARPPRRPSVSPFLNLGIENSGALPSYQAFVLPRVEQQRQQLNQYAMQGRTSKIEELVDPNLRQTGMGGKFQNYSHFYPVQSSSSRFKR